MASRRQWVVVGEQDRIAGNRNDGRGGCPGLDDSDSDDDGESKPDQLASMYGAVSKRGGRRVGDEGESGPARCTQSSVTSRGDVDDPGHGELYVC